MLPERLDVQADRLLDVAASLLGCIARGDAAGQVGHAGPIASVR
jgi:hypothetical protein